MNRPYGLDRTPGESILVAAAKPTIPNESPADVKALSAEPQLARAWGLKEALLRMALRWRKGPPED